MDKLKTTLLCIAACLILLTIGSCNFPSLAPGDDSTTSGGGATSQPAPTAPSNTDGAETIRIPGGTFEMGSAESDLQAADDERPVHAVTVGTFYLYTHEVTNEMYAACVDAGACLPVSVMDSGPTTHTDDPVYANYPVTGVDWNMARDYCTWAGGRLPTEAEWEYAARGTGSLLHPWGDEEAGCDRVNMLGCQVPPDTVEVGSYLLGNSPFEVWDMAGNVWEWVNDWYDADYYQFSPATDPFGPFSPEDPAKPLKVVRGGGLYSSPDQMRSADRAGVNPYRAYDDVGFRCIAEGESLPEGYTDTRDRHEMVPPDPLDGGGETVDDPDPEPYASMGESNASCPDAAGRIHIYAEAETNEPGAWEVTVEGIPFDCTYDEALGLLSCEGPMPAATEYPDVYHVMIYFPGGGLIGHQYPEIPTDCPFPPPEHFSMDLDCPRDGLFTITFFYEPAVTWDIVRLGDTDIPCWPIGDNETRCTVPDRPTGDHYEFYLHGTDATGAEYEWLPWAPVLTDCPVNFLDAGIGPSCFEGHPTVQVDYLPDIMSIASVSEAGVPLDCFGMAPGVLICGNVTAAAGSPTEITVCTDTSACFTETITAPDCDLPEMHLTEFVIEPYCYPPESPLPAASVHYWPFDRHLISATADGTSISCSDWGGGWYVCPGVPGASGDDVEVTLCLEDGACFTGSMTIPICSATGLDDGWRMAAIGCFDETRIYFIIDTGLDWLVPGVDVTYTATDGETTYTCETHPTIPGRVFCGGTRPVSPDPLEFCLQRAGDAGPTCQTYPDYNVWVTGIPDCAPEEPVTEEPEPVDPCSVYTTSGICENHKDQCLWNTDHCESIP